MEMMFLTWKIISGMKKILQTIYIFFLCADSFAQIANRYDFVIVCTSSAVTAMSAFGTTLSVASFPSLDNDGDQISLTSLQGRIIHTVTYDISWYRNELKKDGGWTLEMVDTKNPCSGFSNWK